MANVNGIDVVVPEGYFDIPSDCITKAGDQVAHVSRDCQGEYGKRTHRTSWMKVDESETGVLKKYAGHCVIRKC